jgi:hypothetical protein
MKGNSIDYFYMFKTQMRLFIQRKPIFTGKLLDRLSNILDNAGQIVLGITVIGLFFSKEPINILIIGNGILAVFALWIITIIIFNR